MNAVVPEEPQWKAGGAPYLPYIAQIEQEYGLPTDLLARVAFQESSFREIAVSSAGDVGMFQLNPQDFPSAGGSWKIDAETAAKYLIVLHRNFGDWTLALAGYDWGPSNLRRWLRQEPNTQPLPRETKNYVAEISADTGITGALA